MVPVNDCFLHVDQRNTLRDSRVQLENAFMNPSEERFYPDLFKSHLYAYLVNHDLTGCLRFAFVRGGKMSDQAVRIAFSSSKTAGAKLLATRKLSLYLRPLHTQYSTFTVLPWCWCHGTSTPQLTSTPHRFGTGGLPTC